MPNKSIHRKAEIATLRISATRIEEFQIRIQNITRQLYIKHSTTEKLICLITKSRMLITINPNIIASPTNFLFNFTSTNTKIKRLIPKAQQNKVLSSKRYSLKY